MNKRLTVKFLTFFSIVMLFIALVLAFLSFLPRQQNFADLLNAVSQKTVCREGQVSVDAALLETVHKNGGWLQILNENGKAVYQFSTPKGLQTAYSPGELVSIHNSPKKFGYQIYTWYVSGNPNKLTWIYAMPYTGKMTGNISSDYRTWIAISVLIASVTLIAAFLFGLRIGKPILHALSWIENLAKGIYVEPVNKNKQSISRNENGELRRPYQTFKEVMQSIEELSHNLKESDEKKKQLDKAREEWISGISHDLKTPLSSVKGYADLLASDQYEFSREQTTKYAGIISEKSVYMQDLIEDLNLTFQLSNHALPFHVKPYNLVELTRRSIIDVMNNGIWNDIYFDFENPENDTILYPVDEKWFKRVIDNLLANAAVHNDAGTTVSILVRSIEHTYNYPAVEIIMKDNGKGMDAQTVEHLFDRYYRGTSTDNQKIKGSGLGTAIAKQLIEALGGTITVQSKLQTGTEFIIRFPGKN